MHQTLLLAEKGCYIAAPNPMVGCVIERDGKIVGQGWHQGPGTPHAEIMALKNAGDLARGANVYVNLEPCCHYGRTGPCVDALIKAKVQSVHIAILDPNPLVNSQGVAKLKQHGIEVYVGDEAKAARKLNEVFLHYITKKTPFVTAKWAMSLDGKLTTTSGDSKWITSLEARQHYHAIRQQHAAILVGVDTVIADDPQLIVRHVENPQYQPIRIILDSNGRLPLTAKILDSNLPSKTIIATTNKANKNWCDKLQQMNIDMLVLPENAAGTVDLKALMLQLGVFEISSLLVEGGATVLTSFQEQNLINKYLVYVAPKIIGAAGNMSEAVNLQWRQQTIGTDMFFEGEPICSPE